MTMESCKKNCDEMEQSSELCLCFILIQSFLCLIIVSGNVLTFLAIKLTRRLRAIVSSYFILSLAISDFMVGLTLPYRLAFYIAEFSQEHEIWCLLKFTLSSFTCCASVCNVTAIAIDRYLAIVHPLKYTKFMTKRKACAIIMVCWLFALTVSVVPLYWNNYELECMQCEIENVIPRIYAVTVLTPTLLLMWLIIILTYWKIGNEAKMSVQKLRLHNMDIRLNNDKKSIQVVLLILICFSICWLPFTVVAFMRIYHWNTRSPSVWYEATFSFVLANSGINPLIYAWKNTKFRRAFHRLLHCQLPDKFSYLNSSRNYVQRKTVAAITTEDNSSTLPKNVLWNENGLLESVSDLYHSLSGNKVA